MGRSMRFRQANSSLPSKTSRTGINNSVKPKAQLVKTEGTVLANFRVCVGLLLKVVKTTQAGKSGLSRLLSISQTAGKPANVVSLRA